MPLALNPRLQEVVEKLQDQLVSYLKSQNVEFNSTGKFSCPSPDHEDSSPSCSIVPNSGDRIFHCFGCSNSGNIFKAAHYLEGLPLAGPGWLHTTVKTLCERFNIDPPDVELSKEDQELLEIYNAYEDAARFIKCSTIDKIVPPFEDRGWDDLVGQRYGIGFTDSYTQFQSYLKSAGHAPHILEKAGLSGSNAQAIFSLDNVIFTIFDHNGTPVAFSARNAKYEEDSTVSKYINSSTSPIYKKREILYGLNFAKNLAVKKGLIIVEGCPDWVTMQEKGIRNVAAVCGDALTKEHLSILTNLGITKIFLCLDNDNGGQQATQRILDDVIASSPSMQVEVIMLPTGQDPDDYLKEVDPKNAIEEWAKLEVMSCFKWRLKHFDSAVPMEEVANKMIPLIITEPNIIMRERMAKDLSEHTGVRLSAIQNQMDQITGLEKFKHSERMRSIATSVARDITRNPEHISEIMGQAINSIQDLQKVASVDSLGVEETSKAFQETVNSWKNHASNILGIKTNFKELDEALNGLQEGRAVGIGGKPNHGKSAFVTTLAHNVLKNNPDCLVIMHTTDDSRETFLSRLIAVDQEMPINWITNPKHHLRLPGTAPESGQYNATHKKKWQVGVKNIQEFIDGGRLVVKDSTHGTTLAYTESLIKYYKENNPHKRILVLFDNFHKAQDYVELDERIRYKRMSGQIKLLAERYHVAFLATLEYNKLDEGIKPTDFSIGETVQMSYDLSVIIHLYNQLKDLGISRSRYVIMNVSQEPTPIVELIVSKNKQASFDGSLYFGFNTPTGKFSEYPTSKFRSTFQQPHKEGEDERYGTLGQAKSIR